MGMAGWSKKKFTKSVPFFLILISFHRGHYHLLRSTSTSAPDLPSFVCAQQINSFSIIATILEAQEPCSRTSLAYVELDTIMRIRPLGQCPCFGPPALKYTYRNCPHIKPCHDKQMLKKGFKPAIWKQPTRINTNLLIFVHWKRCSLEGSFSDRNQVLGRNDSPNF